MFPINSIFDKAIAGIRSSVEEQIYSTLSSHLKDYEGPAEDYSDRYGEFKESDIIRPHKQTVNDLGAIKYIMSLFPKRSDIWVITAGYVNNHCGSGPYYSYQTVYLIDNYGTLYEGSYNKGHSPANTTKLVVKDTSELILQPRLNNKLIDIIKKKLIDIEYGTTSQGDSLNRPYDTAYYSRVVKVIAPACQEIATYHNRLYGIINSLKKENAALKAKYETPVPDYMDDLLGLEGK
jgi:hypothetical protein